MPALVSASTGTHARRDVLHFLVKSHHSRGLLLPWSHTRYLSFHSHQAASKRSKASSRLWKAKENHHQTRYLLDLPSRWVPTTGQIAFPSWRPKYQGALGRL